MHNVIHIVDDSKGPFMSRDVTGERCGICAYFQGRAESVCGKCKRHAPVIRGNSTLPMWPNVYDVDWCGDFARVIEKGGGK
jgi:hypothetical protein